MWVWLDRAGPVLFDATLSTALFLTLVVLAMLVCRQPTRRLLIARVAVIRVSRDDSAGRARAFAAARPARHAPPDRPCAHSLIDELEKIERPSPVSIVPEHEAHSLFAI